MITPILIYFLKVNLALAFLYICYRLLFRDDTFFRLRRGVLLSIYLIAFLYPLPFTGFKRLVIHPDKRSRYSRLLFRVAT